MSPRRTPSAVRGGVSAGGGRDATRLEAHVTRWVGERELAPIIGTVIPAYFSAKPSDKMVRHLLRMTLEDCDHYLPLKQVWVVVDGDVRTARLVGELREAMRRETGAAFEILALPQNRGKLWAIKEGMTALLQAQPAVEYVVIRDGDGDHLVSEVPSLVRTAMHLAEAYGHGNVVAIGARRSRHHPMGWIRGELETLLDQLTLDALAYRLAREGRALNLANCLGGGSVPDLSSGFKVFGRQAARELFVDHEPHLCTLTPDHYWHYGPETVTIVEGVLRGLVIAEKLRITWDGQPATSFGEFRHLSLYGELLA
ncbi:MAG: glycosyltransferase, partial [Chloroflexi bacterium]|nr:glycosyltransferase [Chloroflexota bacterium]